jgi:hypothetical protein
MLIGRAQAGNVLAGGGTPEETVVVGIVDLKPGKTITGYGFNELQSPFGDVTPTAVDGNDIRSIWQPTTTGDFIFNLKTEALGATYIDKLVVEYAPGSFITLNASDATYGSATDSSQWSWTTTYWTQSWATDGGTDLDVEVWLT